MADVLVVDCGSASGTHSVLPLLAGLRVEAVSSVGELQQHLRCLKTDGPCAVLCVACSADNESRDVVDETLRSVGSRPVIVIDECFDDEFSRLLLEGGVLDYLDAVNLSCAKLQRRIEWAILRNGHRATAPTLSANHETAADGHDAPECRKTLNRLAPRARQVLELLATGMTPKQIASKLGTKPKTVWNQLANLRLRFGVNSNHALGLLVVQRGQKENDGE